MGETAGGNRDRGLAIVGVPGIGIVVRSIPLSEHNANTGSIAKNIASSVVQSSILAANGMMQAKETTSNIALSCGVDEGNFTSEQSEDVGDIPNNLSLIESVVARLHSSIS
ncbi:hypothetical protein GOP47_0015001 [Adiantum capillus-veneris]|uniref:Uncharacterized protein n=1 Tax=Adiantum capillus-veneris TaxID=13818 RepID=A0A9D4ZCP4_ADICA|nr:hypothetical protein GOP47_0015001 [Adiantum capillus-veneris]